jgi:ABC-type antimicrobial peptide transport system permease subunit
LGRDISVDVVTTFDQQTESMLVTEQLLALLATGFAVVGCALAGIGLYGMVAYAVTRRTSEIGVRMALGAKRVDIVRAVLYEAAKPAILGVCIGIAIALAASRFIGALLYRTEAADPIILAMTVGVLLTISALAAVVPARRAACIDPTTPLRCE